MKEHHYKNDWEYNVCYYMKTKVGDYKGSCSDYRAAGYNDCWSYCPFCGRRIHVLDRKVVKDLNNE